jgi:hypothetical protein
MMAHRLAETEDMNQGRPEVWESKVISSEASNVVF